MRMVSQVSTGFLFNEKCQSCLRDREREGKGERGRNRGREKEE